MYRLILYRAEKEILRSKPMVSEPDETFIAHSRFLWPAADRHEVIEEDEQ